MHTTPKLRLARYLNDASPGTSAKNVRTNPIAAAVVLVLSAGALPAVFAQTAVPAANDETTLKSVDVKDSAPANYTVPIVRFGPLGEKVVMDTPVSINSFSRDLLERQQAVRLSEVLRNDPSVTNVPTNGSFASTFTGVRGYVGGADGFTFDGLAGTPLFVLQGTLEATERFELIKGPASAVYGFAPFASIGGHVNLVPKKPLKTPLTTVTVGVREKNAARVATDISRRFGQEAQFGVRVNAMTESGQPNVEQAKDRRRLLTFAGDWQPSRDIAVEAGYNYYKLRNEAPQAGFTLAPDLPLPKVPDARSNFYQPWSYLETELKIATVGASWSFAPDWKIAVKGLSGERLNQGSTTPGGSISNAQGDHSYPIVYITPGSKFDFRSYQISLNGRLQTAGIRHDVALSVNKDTWTSDQGRVPLGVFESNLYAPAYVSQPLLPDNVPQRRTADSRASGIFLSDSITFNDRWSALIALRQSSIRYLNFDAAGAIELDQSDKKISPLLGVMFKPVPHMSVYANYAEGLQRGGEAPENAANAFQTLPSAKARQYEAGIKYETAQGLALTGAYFDISKPLEYVNASNVFVQAGKQNHTGFELTAGGNITKRLAVVGGALLLNPRQKGTGDPATEGKVALGVPKINIPIYATYSIAQLPGLTLSAGLQYFGKQFVDAGNTVPLAAWTRYDAGLRYASKLFGKDTTFNLNVENINNRKYFASATDSRLALGAPRTVRASLTTTF